MNEPILPSKPRRGRPPGRTAYQEARRSQTRAALLDAAARIFATTPYIRATIDEIITAANIGRATFYDHFDSKLALATAIYDGIAPDWFGHFDQLTVLNLSDEAALQAWVRQLSALYILHGYITPLVEQLAVFERSFRLRLDRDRDALIERLAASGLPSFVAAIGDEANCRLQRVRLRLLFARIDQVCSTVARAEIAPPVDTDSYVIILAQELAALLASPKIA